MKLTVTSNAADVGAELDAMARALPRVVRDEVRESVDAALPKVRAATPVDTGDLRDAWRSEPTPKGARLVNRSRYAGYAPGALESVAESEVDKALDERPPFAQTLQSEVP